MRNYIKAELYRSMRGKYYATILIIGLLAVLHNVLMYLTGIDTTTTFIFTQRGLLSMGLYFVAIFVEMVSKEEYKNDTLKNVVSSGLSRDKIVVGKAITTGIIGSIALVIILGIYIISGFIIFQNAPINELNIVVKDFIFNLLGAYFLYLGSMSILIFISMNIKSTFISVMAYFSVISIIPSGIMFLGLIRDNKNIIKFAEKLSISRTMGVLNNSQNIAVDMGWGIMLGLIFMIIFTSLSLISFRKKDI